MAVAVLDHNFNGEYSSKNRFTGRFFSWKRVFVQIDNGSALGIELERGENAHNVKKKLQIALNVPAEESSLMCGDQVLNKDLSRIRTDSPLLLTRNHMHRSCSTHCLSPNGNEVKQCDRSSVIEILGCSSPSTIMIHLVKDIIKGIKNGVDPVPIHNGMGGAYYFRNAWGEHAAIIKPTDEEPFAPNNPKGFVGKYLGLPGLKRSVRVGETGFREVAAYLLDYDDFSKVPPTMLVKITHNVFHRIEGVDCKTKGSHNKSLALNKIASLQQFIPHDYDASDHGTSGFPVSAVHRIGILDIRIFNTDRHAGNLLVRKLDTGGGKFEVQTELIPIDHGLCLPESLEDPYFEWIHWPQASIPFSAEELRYIENLDPVKDVEMLRTELPMIHEASLRVLVLSTTFLKEAVAFGLCLSEIGEMMSRQFAGKEEEPSELEFLCMEAMQWVEENKSVLSEVKSKEDDDGDEFAQFDLDSEDDGPRGSSRNLLSRLAEGNEAKDGEDKIEVSKKDIGTHTSPVSKWTPFTSNLPGSLKGLSSIINNKFHSGVPKTRVNTKTNYRYIGNSIQHQSVGRSTNNMLPPSTNFVKLTDLSVNEWSTFFKKFQELLPTMVYDRKQTIARGTWLTQRLGASCQF